jgi:ABC-type antimicrobial peptide transport system permease subunit
VFSESVFSESTSPPRFIEPTRALPLRWGTYEDRLWLGLLLIVAGAAAVQGSNTYALNFLAAGTVVHAVGWSILPAQGWRRVLVVLPATAQTWLFVAGPQWVWTLLVPYLAWLIVRHRPLRSYITVLFPLATSLVLPPFVSEYSGMPLALVISLSVFVASAWLARVIAARPSPRELLRSPSKTG